jgi:hypothetical protein
MQVTLYRLDASFNCSVLAIVGHTGKSNVFSVTLCGCLKIVSIEFSPSESSIVDDFSTGQFAHQLTNNDIRLL